jgi:hypothetical protein
MRWDIVDRVGKRFAVMSPRRLAVAYRTTYSYTTLQYTHDATTLCSTDIPQPKIQQQKGKNIQQRVFASGHPPDY